MRLIAILVPIFLMAPELVARWQADQASIRFNLDQNDEHVAQCVQSGLEVKHRLEFRVCRKRGTWLDHCDSTEVMARSIKYDPVSESYSIITDIINDNVAPATVLVTDVEEAQRVMQEFAIPSEFLKPEGEAAAGKNHYVTFRIRGFCQQDEKSIFTQIPYYLTFGIFRFAGFDTGWVDYELTN